MAEGSSPSSGVELRFYVVDLSKNPLPEATVAVSVANGPKVLGRPREEDSIAVVRGLEGGLAEIEVTCPGYETFRMSSVVPWKAGFVQGILMNPAGRLSGVVTRLGQEPGPCQVYCWQQGREKDAASVALDEGQAGRFTLDAAPLGPVRVVAISEQWGQSEVVEATVAQEGAPTVELHLDSSSWVTGSIVDRISGEPLRDASAHLRAGDGGGVADVSGTPVDADGRFLLAGASPGSCSVLLEAPGYAPASRNVVGQGPEIDLGPVALSRKRPVMVCLVAEGSPSFSGYGIQSVDGSMGYLPFGEDGCLTLEDVSLERLEYLVTAPDGTYHGIHSAFVPEGEPIEVPVHGPCSARIRFQGIDARPRMLVTLLFEGSQPGIRLTRLAYVDDVEPIVLDGLLPGKLSADLRLESEILGSASVVIEDTGPNEIVISRGRELLVRVVGPNGEPIPDADISFRPRGAETASLQRTGTDGIGSLVLGEGAADGIVASVSHAGLGVRAGVSLDAAKDGTIDVLLDPSAQLSLRFNSPDGPPRGVRCVLGDPLVDIVIGPDRATDATGEVVFRHLHPGSYLVYVDDSRFFPFEEVFVVSESQALDRELRGRGDLTFSLLGADGGPRPGVSVHLEPVAALGNLGDWIRRGWVQVPFRGLVTGPEGTLTIQGLAAGEYSWSVAGASGRTVVSVGRETQEQIVLE